MDQKKEALEQIKSIHEIFTSGNRLIGSPKGFYVSGGACLFIAGLQALEKVRDTGLVPATFANGVILFLCIGGLIFSLRVRQDKAEHAIASKFASLHPLVKKSLGVIKPIFIAGIGLSIMWFSHMDRVIALWMVLFGIVTNVWGRFLDQKVERFSFTLIGGGIAAAGLSEFGLLTEHLQIISLAYLGVWSLLLGTLVSKHQGQE